MIFCEIPRVFGRFDTAPISRKSTWWANWLRGHGKLHCWTWRMVWWVCCLAIDAGLAFCGRFVFGLLYSWGWRHRPAAPFGLKAGSARTQPHCICQQLSWLHVGAVLILELCWIQVGPCWGYVELCWDHVGSCSVKIGARLAHLGAMLGLWLAERPFLKFFWGYVGPSSPILSYVGAMAVLFSRCHLHSRILLKKALPSGLRVVCLN